MDASRNEEGRAAIERIAARAGEHLGDLSSGHERWRIYRRAVDLPGSWTDLLDAVRYEPDPSIASATAVRLLERVPPDLRNAVVAALAEGKERDFAGARSKELGVLDSLSAGHYDSELVRARLGSWSTWLQIRAASEVIDEGILAELVRMGRTRRVRSVAGQRLKALGRRDPGN